MNKCTCKSCNGFNDAHEGIDEIPLKAPHWSEKDIICVDACISGAILMLWKFGIVTRGCCCGHNKTGPSVIVAGDEYPSGVLQLLSTYDGRDWTVLRWELVPYKNDEKVYDIQHGWHKETGDGDVLKEEG